MTERKSRRFLSDAENIETETGMNSHQFAPLWYIGIVNEYRATRGHRDEIAQAQKSPGYFHPRTPGRDCS